MGQQECSIFRGSFSDRLQISCVPSHGVPQIHDRPQSPSPCHCAPREVQAQDFWRTKQTYASQPKRNIKIIVVANLTGLQLIKPQQLKQVLQRAFPGFIMPSMPSMDSMVTRLQADTGPVHLSRACRKVLDSSGPPSAGTQQAKACRFLLQSPKLPPIHWPPASFTLMAAPVRAHRSSVWAQGSTVQSPACSSRLRHICHQHHHERRTSGNLCSTAGSGAP